MKIKPTLDRVLIEPFDAPEKTAGGLHIPKTVEQQMLHEVVTGRVLAIGPGARNKALELVPMSVKVGDIVSYKKYDANEIVVNGEKLAIIRDGDIYCTVGETDADDVMAAQVAAFASQDAADRMLVDTAFNIMDGRISQPRIVDWAAAERSGASIAMRCQNARKGISPDNVAMVESKRGEVAEEIAVLMVALGIGIDDVRAAARRKEELWGHLDAAAGAAGIDSRRTELAKISGTTVEE